MMTTEQRYLFDLSGFLHLENVLSDVELQRCREASDQYINTPSEELSSDFSTQNGIGYENGFAWDKALEALVFHPAYWPMVKEFTENRPRFKSGTMIVNFPEQETKPPRFLHCAKEDFGRYVTRYDVLNGRIFCNDFVIFPYFWDVKPGDGGLVVLPGSHKSEFDRPDTLFDGGKMGNTPPEGTLNITPKSGDVVVLSELTTHGVLNWQAKDRKRCILSLRYTLQYREDDYLEFSPNQGEIGHLSDTLRERLSPETLELMARGGYQEIKEIVHRNVVTLS